MFTRRMIRMKAMQYLYAFFAQKRLVLPTWCKHEAWQKLSKQFAEDVAVVHEIKIELLHLLLLWGDLDEAHEAESLKPAVRHLNSNLFLQKLCAHPTFVKLSKEQPPLWSKASMQRWYYDSVQEAPLLLAYKNSPTKSLEEDLILMKKLVKKHIFSNRRLQADITKHYLGWSVDKQMVNPFMLSFIKKIGHEDATSFAWCQHSSFEQEEAFYRRLVTAVLDKGDFVERKINEQIVNWDRERLILLDAILIKMGVVEALFLNDISPSVAINEYVEIAKLYSTPKSHQFVHGLLNTIIQDANKV